MISRALWARTRYRHPTSWWVNMANSRRHMHLLGNCVVSTMSSFGRVRLHMYKYTNTQTEARPCDNTNIDLFAFVNVLLDIPNLSLWPHSLYDVAVVRGGSMMLWAMSAGVITPGRSNQTEKVMVEILDKYCTFSLLFVLPSSVISILPSCALFLIIVFLMFFLRSLSQNDIYVSTRR
jgi:hypothetical protein